LIHLCAHGECNASIARLTTTIRYPSGNLNDHMPSWELNLGNQWKTPHSSPIDPTPLAKSIKLFLMPPLQHLLAKRKAIMQQQKCGIGITTWILMCNDKSKNLHHLKFKIWIWDDNLNIKLEDDENRSKHISYKKEIESKKMENDLIANT